MGTLEKPKEKKTNSLSQSAIEQQAIEKKRLKLEKRLNKEYGKIRNQLEEIRQAFNYVEDARSHDDIHYRLLQLEKATRRVRKGSLLTSGAKLHRKLLRVLSKLSVQ